MTGLGPCQHCSFSWVLSCEFQHLSFRCHCAFVCPNESTSQAGVASSPVPMKGFFTEPNLLEHAKLIIAATQAE